MFHPTEPAFDAIDEECWTSIPHPEKATACPLQRTDSVHALAHLLLNSTLMTDLMTVGYEGMKPEKFLELLKRFRVQRIIDVRELPISRRPGFSKAALSKMLEDANIRYTHIAALGCPRDIRHAYREDGNWTLYTERFSAYLKTRDTEIAELQHVVDQERCCLLCFETNFNFCHRMLIAERLASFTDGLRINHLTGPIQGRVVERRALAAA